MKTRIVSTGMYAPKKVMTNFDLEKMVDTSDRWIRERTGISERRIADVSLGETPVGMAKEACLQAFEKADMNPSDIDLILFGAIIPEQKLPSSACILQGLLPVKHTIPALDFNAACSGFVYGLTLADSMIRCQQASKVLLVCSEVLTSEVPWDDRNVCILFGDGCGVFLLEAHQGDSEVLASILGADGTKKDYIVQPVGGAAHPLDQENVENYKKHFALQGQEVFRTATRTMSDCVKQTLSKAGLKLSDVDWLIAHQANLRIIEMVGKLLRFPKEKVIINVQKYGNTSAASIPIAFHEALEEGKIKRGDILVFVGFGAGFTFGCNIVRY